MWLPASLPLSVNHERPCLAVSLTVNIQGSDLPFPLNLSDGGLFTCHFARLERAGDFLPGPFAQLERAKDFLPGSSLTSSAMGTFYLPPTLISSDEGTFYLAGSLTSSARAGPTWHPRSL